MTRRNLVGLITHSFAACVFASVLVSCAAEDFNPEQARAAQAQREAALIEKIKATCSAFGFTPNSAAFGQCAIKQQQLEAAKEARANEDSWKREQLYQQNLDRMLNRQPATPVLTCTTDRLNQTTCQ